MEQTSADWEGFGGRGVWAKEICFASMFSPVSEWAAIKEAQR
jgi:hypothetical protein